MPECNDYRELKECQDFEEEEESHDVRDKYLLEEEQEVDAEDDENGLPEHVKVEMKKLGDFEKLLHNLLKPEEKDQELEKLMEEEMQHYKNWVSQIKPRDKSYKPKMTPTKLPSHSLSFTQSITQQVQTTQNHWTP